MLLLAATACRNSASRRTAGDFQGRRFHSTRRRLEIGQLRRDGERILVPGNIETYHDLNGDGRPEAVVTEGGAICYGMTGTALLARLEAGERRLEADARRNRDAGFPRHEGRRRMARHRDGRTRFLLPVWRWNGKAYALNRFEYEGKRCKP